MLEWFADAPDPDAGLFGFRRISESLGSTPVVPHDCCATRARSPSGWPGCWPPPATPPTCSSASRRACGCSAGDLQPLTAEALTEEMLAAAGRHDEPEDGGPRRSAASAAASCSGSRPATCSGCIDVADVGRRAVPAHRRHARGDARGRRPRSRAPSGASTTRRPGWRSSRWAGTAASSCPTAATPTCCSCTTRCRAPTPQVARRTPRPVANELRRLLALPGAGPGARRSTPTCAPRASRARWCARSTSYAAYYAKWSKVWEAQALLRADAVVGDADLRRRFEELIDPLRYPRGRDQRRRRGRGPPDQGPGRRGAAARAAPTRTPTSSSAAAGSPTSSGRSSCCRCGTPARVPGLRTTRTLDGARRPPARPT